MSRVFVLAVLALCGCKQLFPDIAPPETEVMDMGATDLLGADLYGQALIHGQVCVLLDVRDFRTCAKQPLPGLRVTLEETGAFSILDANNLFLLGYDKTMPSATLVVSDPRGAWRTTVSTVLLGEKGAGNLALLTIATSTEVTMTATLGFTSDPTRGAVLGWAVDASATPQPGVRAAALSGAEGPFYDGISAGELDDQGPTRARGLVAYYNVMPKTAKLTLTPSPGLLRADQFDLPVRAGAITISLLPLPAQ